MLQQDKIKETITILYSILLYEIFKSLIMNRQLQLLINISEEQIKITTKKSIRLTYNQVLFPL